MKERKERHSTHIRHDGNAIIFVPVNEFVIHNVTISRFTDLLSGKGRCRWFVLDAFIHHTTIRWLVIDSLALSITNINHHHCDHGAHGGHIRSR